MIDYFGVEIRVGDKVRDYFHEQVTTVKSISAGGTVTLKSAIDGRRCFQANELVLVERAKV